MTPLGNTQFQQGAQPVKRQIAYKTWLSNLSNGNFIQGSKSPENFSPNYVEVNNLQISRVNIVATIVEVFKNDDGNYFSFTLDDGTAAIRMKAFNEDTTKLLSIEKGNLVLVIGRVREYQGEIYIWPEITKIVGDPNIELIRKAELLRNFGKPKKLKSNLNVQILQTKITPQKPVDPSHEELRQKVIDILMENDERGAEISFISKAINKDDAATETVVKELMTEGEIYENKPGLYKAV